MVEGNEVILFLNKPVHVIRKHRARRMTLSIRADSPLRLTSNLTTSRDEIIRFLNSNRQWIQKNVEKIDHLEKQYQKPKLEAGALFPFLGELKYFIFSKTKAGRIYFAVEDGFLICYLPQNCSYLEIDQAVLEKNLQNYFKKKGTAYLTERLNHWATRTNLHPTQIKFGRATTRWGSCNSKKQINLNWKLICHAPHLIDYVIVHELCHLRHLNHSEDFWSLLAEFMPEFKVYEKTLDQQTPLSRFLNSK